LNEIVWKLNQLFGGEMWPMFVRLAAFCSRLNRIRRLEIHVGHKGQQLLRKHKPISHPKAVKVVAFSSTASRRKAQNGRHRRALKGERIRLMAKILFDSIFQNKKKKSLNNFFY
jgi:hypothetical protein